MSDIKFVPVDISEFMGKEVPSEQPTNGIAVLTPTEEALYSSLINLLSHTSKEKQELIEKRMQSLQRLAKSIEDFPSLLERTSLAGGIRTPQTLINSLVKHQNTGDNTLNLPSKAVLGKGYIVAKLHTFSSMHKLAVSLGADEALILSLFNEMMSMMFTIMAEDVYINLISDASYEWEYRRQWALSLLLLWEHRNDQTIESVAPVLSAVWAARRTLAPTFGTMMGTSELMNISMNLGEEWIEFIRGNMMHENVRQAMEEFLFGISYEQITKLKEILKTRGIKAIGRDEVSSFLGEHVKADVGTDYRDFYTMYAIRRDNARARRRLGVNGPHKTLEDYFISFMTEQNTKKQNQDKFAKLNENIQGEL